MAQLKSTLLSMPTIKPYARQDKEESLATAKIKRWGSVRGLSAPVLLPLAFMLASSY